jgi:hypothetical protein
MSRAAGGTYTLPTGNPVISGTDITVTWGNTTMNDIATEMTDSLSRSGKGGMSAALQLTNGTVTSPGLTFVSDANSGLYRIAADNIGMSVGGVKIVDYANGAFSFVDTAVTASVGPIFSIFRDSASPAAADLIGEISFDGNNDAAEKTVYAALSGQIDDVTDGTEDGTLLVKTMTAGTLTTQLTISDNTSTFAGTVSSYSAASSAVGPAAITLDCLNSYNQLEWKQAGSHRGYISADGADTYMGAEGTLNFRTGSTALAGGTTALTLDTSQNATFAGDITMATSPTFVKGGIPAGATEGFAIRPNGAGGAQYIASGCGSYTGAFTHQVFLNGNGDVGSIDTSGSSTIYSTSSDYRLKENVVTDWDATTRLKQLKPSRFNFIADANKTVDGFLAHEAQAVVPECVIGLKDAMKNEEYEVSAAVEATYDDDGNELTAAVEAVMATRSVPDYQGIDQSKLVPLLVKTIQELEARITALEA